MTSEPAEGTSIWVTSDVAADQKSYVATVHYTDDLSHPMTADETVAYAAVVLRAAGAAVYEAAVFAQLTKKLEMPQEEAGRLLLLFREKRGQDTWTAGPLTLTAGLSAFTLKGFLRCRAGDLEWQWEPAEAEQHARHTLEVAGAVEDDALYRDLLVDNGVDPARARAVVEDIVNFRA